jgi:hypothetical protein
MLLLVALSMQLESSGHRGVIHYDGVKQHRRVRYAMRGGLSTDEDGPCQDKVEEAERIHSKKLLAPEISTLEYS